jgi:SHS family lactate transporter-like MFS transporter
VLRNNDYAFVMSIFIACVAVFLAIVTAFGPEARGAPFGARAASGA